MFHIKSELLQNIIIIQYIAVIFDNVPYILYKIDILQQFLPIKFISFIALTIRYNFFVLSDTLLKMELDSP